MKSGKMNKVKSAGFTLIEFVVVIALIVAAVSIGTASFSAVFNARAKKAVVGLDDMLAQCKVFNLSGRSCYTKIQYDNNNNSVTASVVKDNGTADKADDVVLETTVLGNRYLNVTVSGNKIEGNTTVEIKFSGTNGEVEYCNMVTGAGSTPLFAGNKLSEQFIFEGGGRYVLTLYKKTGLHSYKKGSAV